MLVASEFPLVPYLYSREVNNVNYFCMYLGDSFYKFPGYLDKYLKLRQVEKDCRSPTIGDNTRYEVIAKVQYHFMFAIGEVKIDYSHHEDSPVIETPLYVPGSLHLDTSVTCYDSGY